MEAMIPKILFTDIDGTLLNKDRELSINTLNQIKRINSILSIPVILVSARMPKSMRILQSQLGLSNEIICYNGALSLGQDDSSVLHDDRISKEIALRIIEKSKIYDLHFSTFANNRWMISKNDKWAEREIRNTRVTPESFDRMNFDRIVDGGIHKILLMGDVIEIDAIQLWIEKNLIEKVSFYRSKETYIEINPFKSNKWNAIEKILSTYNINFADAMAIGDNYNDIEMIKYAGIGVAVDNAPEEIKKNANFICPSNINDGVAFTIEKYFR